MEKNIKKKQVLLTILGVISLIVITVGVTYAFFNYAKEGTTDNTIQTGSITFLYTEVSGVGKGISLTEAYPVADSIGKVQVGEGKVFDFKVTSNISMNSSIGYQVTARKKTGSTLDDSAVKVYLTEVNGTEQELLLSKYSELSQTDKVDSSKFDEKVLYESRVPANTANYEKNFRLRMWVSDDTDFSDGSMNDKTFTLTVNVYADGKVVTSEEQNSYSNASIKSVSVDNTELTKVINKDYQYETTLPEGTTSTTLDIETENKYAKVRVEKIDNLAYSDTTSNIKRLSIKKTLDLNLGDNYFKITVTSENKKIIKEYKIKISVVESVSIFGKQYSVIQKSPTLTTTSEESGDASGLYKSTATNTGNLTYYFRGNVENNYVSFAGFVWRIVRINEDGTIRIVMQDGINDNISYPFYSKSNNNYNNKEYMYYSNGDAKTVLNNWYQTNIRSKENLESKIISGEYFCEEAKVASDSSFASNSGTDMTIFNFYTPNFKCSSDGNRKGVVNASIGLLTYDEVIYAGGFFGSRNNNYYLNSNIAYWTMSPAGFWGGNVRLWNVYDSGSLGNNNDYNSYTLRPVLVLKSDTQISDGNGTKENPFVVE